MKKFNIMIAIILLLAGCQSEISPASTPIAAVTASTPTTIPTIIPTITPAPTAIPVVELFQLPFPGELLLFNHASSITTGWAITREKLEEGFKISYTENQGQDWYTTILPTKQPWENAVDKNHLIASLNTTGPSWILLSSGPSASLIYKTLYRSDDKGRSWSLLGDYTGVIDGDIKGIMFIDEKEGWIASSYRGIELVPFYHTVDAGKTWTLEPLPLEKGYRYGNVSLPSFSEVGHATVRVEYVSDTDNKAVYYESTDNGGIWQRFTFNSILQLNGDKNALEVVRQFAMAWQAQDEKKVRSLFEAGTVEYVSQYITAMKNHKRTFYSAYSSLKKNEPIEAEFCMNLYYQNDDELAEYETGATAVCLHKQPKSNKWKIYMLD
jgi:hypothetical protein